jgi:major membrane immunogen (membrane-anchored lipoprotein)
MKKNRIFITLLLAIMEGNMKKYFLLSTVLLLTLVITGCKKANENSVTTDNQGGESVTISVAPTAGTPSATNAPVVTNAPTTAAAASDASTTVYKDGVYTVDTPIDNEKYYTEATVEIKDGKIASVDWTIIDTGHDNEPFDEDYYKVMEPYGETCVQQSHDDWSGSRGYSDALIETQDVDQVDAVTGATWTNRKFKQVVKLALEQAKAE